MYDRHGGSLLLIIYLVIFAVVDVLYIIFTCPPTSGMPFEYDKTNLDILLHAMKISEEEEEETEEEENHKLIHDYAREHMNPDDTPPLPAIRYGVDRILLPGMIWECVPQLLDGLALAEQVRLQIVENGKEALTWDNFHRGKESKDLVDGDRLSQDEREFLKKVVKESRVQSRREVYRILVDNICFSYIFHIRRSNSFLIPAYFYKYFPREEELVKLSKQGLPLWFSKMTPKEISGHQTVRKAATSFITDVNKWEEETFGQILNGGNRRDPEYQKMFEEKFQPGIPWNILVSNMRNYLEKIETDYDKMQNLFSGS